MKLYKFLSGLVKEYDRAFNRFLDKLIKTFGNNISVLLFGSRASGKAKDSSDYDVAIIVRDDVDRVDFMEKISMLKNGHVPIDIVVIKISELDNETVKKMLTPCKVLWDGLRMGFDKH